MLKQPQFEDLVLSDKQQQAVKAGGVEDGGDTGDNEDNTKSGLGYDEGSGKAEKPSTEDGSGDSELGYS